MLGTPFLLAPAADGMNPHSTMQLINQERYFQIADPHPSYISHRAPARSQSRIDVCRDL